MMGIWGYTELDSRVLDNHIRISVKIAVTSFEDNSWCGYQIEVLIWGLPEKFYYCCCDDFFHLCNIVRSYCIMLCLYIIIRLKQELRHDYMTVAKQLDGMPEAKIISEIDDFDIKTRILLLVFQ